MKKLLTFLVLLCVSAGAWAAEFTWPESGETAVDDYSITASNPTLGSDANTFQLINVDKPGAFAAFVEATANYGDGDWGGQYKGLGENATRCNLIITGELNADDLAALSNFSSYTSLDLKDATISDGMDAFADMNMSGLQYLRLPCGDDFTDNQSWASLKTDSKNQNLCAVFSTESVGSSATSNKIYIHSFVANSLPTALAGSIFYDNDNNANKEVQSNVKYISMSGIYGNNDLYNHSTNTQIFTSNPAVWDFTGADFTSLQLTGNTTYSKYYAIDDPFGDGNMTFPSYSNENPYNTNSFYYFSTYAKATVEITLPTEIEELPDQCIVSLGQENNKEVNGVRNYNLVYGTSSTNDAEDIDLVIPEQIVTVGYECAAGGKIKSITFAGGNLTTVNGGAFSGIDDLADVQFNSGLTNCKLGHGAFSNTSANYQLKQIVLTEGIVSLGYQCFYQGMHLESVRLPQSLEYIGSGCFQNCYALSSIIIPPIVKKIGKKAFELAALKSVYLTTTNPNDIPIIWSAGADLQDENATFCKASINGYNTIGVKDASDTAHGGFGDMTFEQAVDWYFSHDRCMAALYFPDELYWKVRADISETYLYTTGDDIRVPGGDDYNKRYNLSGTNSTGEYSQAGWSQFFLMKAYSTDPGSNLFEKEYSDVWYTMCFPFDLTDEQLASAFTANFNIVDFSAVEIRTDEDTQKQTLVLHFNEVAETVYKDEFGNIYERKRDEDGNVIRELDENNRFSYNIYYKVNNGIADKTKEYRHVIVGSGSETLFKTKTFAIDGNKSNDIVTIDGYLAQAGHPYMIHPAIGVAVGNPEKRCSFAGITWADEDEDGGYDQLYEDNARTVDLGGIAYYGLTKPENLSYPSSGDDNFQENNFDQAAYSDYQGQTYTFIGNWADYDRTKAANYIADNPEPTSVEDPGPEPKYKTPTEPEGTLTAPDPAPTNPEAETEGWDSFWNNVGQYIISWPGYDSWKNDASLKAFLGLTDDLTEQQYIEISARCEAYDTYLTASKNFSQAAYDEAYAAYVQNQADWAAWNAYSTDPDGYYNTWLQTVYATWNTKNLAYQQYLKDYAEWEEAMSAFKVMIPKYAYFLARPNNSVYPKYYRETADEDNRTGGYWNQYTAIVKPNDAAKAGIEGITTSQGVKSYNIAFNEDYEGEFNVNEIKDIVAEAEEKGQKVEYMNIVYSINGEIVGQGSHSLNNLPKGMYIINGKKYLVK